MADGSIRIETSIDTKGLQADLKRLEKSIEKSASEIESLRSKMNELGSAKIPTQEYIELQKYIDSTEKKLNALVERQEKFLATGGRESSATYQRMLIDIDQLRNTLEYAKSDMQDLVDSGKAFTLGADTEEYTKAAQRVEELTGKMSEDSARAAEIQSTLAAEEQRLASIKENATITDQKIVEMLERRKVLMQQIADMEKAGLSYGYQEYDSAKRELSVIEQQVKAYSDVSREKGKALDFSGIAKQLSKIKSLAIKAFNALTGGSKKSDVSMKKGLNTILKYGFGIRSLYFLFNKVRNAIKEGFDNLVQHSKPLNESFSALKSSLTQLKNAFAVAFAPIVQMAIPYIQSLINAIIQALNYVSQLYAVISGASTWTKAVAVQEDYAASLNNTASAAKKAVGALASFDTLEVLSKKDTGSTDGSNIKDMFESVPTDNGFKLDPKQMGKEFSDWLADSLENIDWDIIKEKAEEAGRNIARFLNGVWENERLARDLGMTMGEALNTAVSFAYGFIDETEWQQMGRFLGTIVQSGLDTFDEEEAGKTAGMLVNGLADAIIGYFQTYDAGSVGKEIANFVNSAVEETDADKIATAAALLAGGFINEISTFFETINAEEIGGKISQAFIKFFTYAGEDGTVGENVGHALSSSINKGVDLLLGADIGGMASALGGFFADIVYTAISQINWVELLKGLILAPLDVLIGFTSGIVEKIGEAFGATEEQLEEFHNKTKDTQSLLNTLWGDMGSLANQLDATAAGITYNAEQLKYLQEQYGFTDEDIDSIIQSMIDMDNQLDLSSLGLEGYAGSWSDFSANAVGLISGVKNENSDMVNSVIESGETLKSRLGDTSDYIINKNAEIATSTSSARELIGQEHIKINESLNSTNEKAAQTAEKVSELSANAENSLSAINTNYSDTLNNMASMTEEWLAGMQKYFSIEQWQTFSDNITGTMLGCLDTFTNDWNTYLTEWSETNNELYFGYDIWYEQFSDILLAYTDVNGEFMSEWQANMDTWWNTMVTPFFTVAQWQLFGTNMKTGIMQGFKVIVNEIGGVLNNIIAMFDEAFKKLEESMNDLIDSYNSSAGVLGTSTLSRVHYNSMGKINIPKLADGAVIRGGNPFIAMLGDQHRGQTNIEAPANLIRDMTMEGIERSGIISAMQSSGNNAQIVLDGEVLGRLALPHILDEWKRGGYNLEIL